MNTWSLSTFGCMPAHCTSRAEINGHPSFIKVICLTLSLLTTLAAAKAQGTLYFTAQVTNSVYSRTASFSLTTNVLRYGVETVGLNHAQIRGPGTPESTAPVIFDLQMSGVCDPPLGDFPGDCFFDGRLSLTTDQVSQLVAGEWYIDSYGTIFNGPPMRGQILPVPEPSVSVLCGFSTALLWLWTRLLTKTSPIKV